MKRRGDALSLCRGFIAAVSWIVPSRDRVRWRREWDAEIAFWWRRREEKPAFELFSRSLLALRDAVGFRIRSQQRELRPTHRQRRFMADFLRDLRYAFRTLTRQAGVTTVVILTMALAIGAKYRHLHGGERRPASAAALRGSGKVGLGSTLR